MSPSLSILTPVATDSPAMASGATAFAAAFSEDSNDTEELEEDDRILLSWLLVWSWCFEFVKVLD